MSCRNGLITEKTSFVMPEVLTVRLIRIGNSLGFMIPKEYAKKNRIRIGANGRVIILGRVDS